MRNVLNGKDNVKSCNSEDFTITCSTSFDINGTYSLVKVFGGFYEEVYELSDSLPIYSYLGKQFFDSQNQYDQYVTSTNPTFKVTLDGNFVWNDQEPLAHPAITLSDGINADIPTTCRDTGGRIITCTVQIDDLEANVKYNAQYYYGCSQDKRSIGITIEKLIDPIYTVLGITITDTEQCTFHFTQFLIKFLENVTGMNITGAKLVNENNEEFSFTCAFIPLDPFAVSCTSSTTLPFGTYTLQSIDWDQSHSLLSMENSQIKFAEDNINLGIQMITNQVINAEHPKFKVILLSETTPLPSFFFDINGIKAEIPGCVKESSIVTCTISSDFLSLFDSKSYEVYYKDGCDSYQKNRNNT